MVAGGAEEANYLNLYHPWPYGLALAPEPSVISGYQPREMNLDAVNSWPESVRGWNPGRGQAYAIPSSASYVVARLQLPCYRGALGSVDAAWMLWWSWVDGTLRMPGHAHPGPDP
jgi:hypothetical protein